MTESIRDDAGQICYRRLRRLIVYGQIPAGERLREIEWGQRLGSHRSAVREALVLLAHEGLLRRGERGGFFIPCFQQADLVEIVEARLVIELGALGLIARKQPAEETLQPLILLCENMQRLIDSDLLLGYAEADRKFHELLVGLAGSSRLNSMYAHAPLPHLLPNYQLPEIRPETYTRSLADHLQIISYLQGREYEKAYQLLEQHISLLLHVPI